jgi:Holliday junction resolvasome RuvABC endonuclease subunit
MNRPDAAVARRAPRVLGLDLSLTRSGYASEAGTGVLVPPAKLGHGMARLAWIRDQVLELCAAARAELVVVEGYSFGSKGRAVFSLGELGGVVRLALHEARLPYLDVAPGTLKRYSAGKGNCGKAEVLAAAIRRLDYAGHDDNEADALWLRALALDAYGTPLADLPTAHRAALSAVTWPELELQPC